MREWVTNVCIQEHFLCKSVSQKPAGRFSEGKALCFFAFLNKFYQ